MTIRLFKALTTLCVALVALGYGLNNIANIDQAFGAVAFALSREGQAIYPAGIMPGLAAAPLVWLALGIIIMLELAAGLLAAWGGVGLLSKLRDPLRFEEAKGPAVWGAGLGVLVWFGLFAGIGGAVFQMWQTEAGALSLAGAFQYGALCFFTLIFVSLAEPV